MAPTSNRLDPAPPSATAMQSADYLAVIMRRKWLIAGVVAFAVLAALLATLLPAPKWTASAVMRVEPDSSLSGGSVRADDVTYLDRLINTYSTIAGTQQFADQVAHRAGLSEAPHIEIADLAKTNLMDMRATTGDPASAAKAANTAAVVLLEQVKDTAAAAAGVSDASFQTRTNRIEGDVAKAETELAGLRAGGLTASERERSLKLQEEIRGGRLSLAALRDNYETYRTARTGRAGATTVATPALPPTQASNRHVAPALALGLVLGLIGGLGLAFAAERLTRRFRSDAELEDSIHAPVLGVIPTAETSGEPVVFNHGSRAEDAYRRMLTALVLSSSEPARTLLITSAIPGEGKSTVTANLASSLARGGRSVLVVDADLRRPTVHTAFDVPNTEGLGELLELTYDGAPRSAPPKDEMAYVRRTRFAGLSVLPAGKGVEDPVTLLGSPAMGALLRRLGDRFDYVIVDSPAVLPVSDALALTPHVEGVLLVAGAAAARDDVVQVDKQLRRVGAAPLGIVMNQSGDTRSSHYDVEPVERGPSLGIGNLTRHTKR